MEILPGYEVWARFILKYRTRAELEAMNLIAPSPRLQSDLIVDASPIFQSQVSDSQNLTSDISAPRNQGPSDLVPGSIDANIDTCTRRSITEEPTTTTQPHKRRVAVVTPILRSLSVPTDSGEFTSHSPKKLLSSAINNPTKSSVVLNMDSDAETSEVNPSQYHLIRDLLSDR